MKKLVNLRCCVAIGNDDYCDTSIWSHIHYVEMSECDTIEYTFETFKEAFAAVHDHKIRNAEIGYTLFRNRPIIEISWGDFYRNKSEMTEKTFKPIRVKWDWQEVTRMFTMKNLSDLLPAEQFCEWLKDHGITMVGSFSENRPHKIN